MITAAHIVNLLAYAADESARCDKKDLSACRRMVRAELWRIESVVRRAEVEVAGLPWRELETYCGDGAAGEPPVSVQ